VIDVTIFSTHLGAFCIAAIAAEDIGPRSQAVQHCQVHSSFAAVAVNNQQLGALDIEEVLHVALQPGLISLHCSHVDVNFIAIFVMAT
jgi:hypothetical protein